MEHLSHDRAIQNLAAGGESSDTWAKIANSSLEHLSRKESDQIFEKAADGAGLAIVFGTQAVVSRTDPNGGIGEFFFTNLLFGVVWVVGFALGRKFEEADEARERAARAEREREERARAAVAEERARIARELHDVVGHSVSVMTVQASGVRRLLRPDGVLFLGAGETTVGFDQAFVPVLARAAVAVGVAGVFIETHQDPDKAPSDGPNMMPLKDMEGLLRTLIAFDRLAKP